MRFFLRAYLSGVAPNRGHVGKSIHVSDYRGYVAALCLGGRVHVRLLGEYGCNGAEFSLVQDEIGPTTNRQATHNPMEVLKLMSLGLDQRWHRSSYHTEGMRTWPHTPISLGNGLQATNAVLSMAWAAEGHAQGLTVHGVCRLYSITN